MDNDSDKEGLGQILRHVSIVRVDVKAFSGGIPIGIIRIAAVQLAFHKAR